MIQIMIRIIEDIKVIIKRDPAKPNPLVVFLFHPGVKALRRHRLAHFLWHNHFKWLAEIIYYRTRKLTGIEVHPGAKLGRRVFIDHGMGLVIGETSIIGDDCALFHGVTLAGNTDEPIKRHPTLGKNVKVYPNATIIGPISIGDNCVIGANSIVVKNMAPGSVALGLPSHRVIEMMKK
jgi:serine O-acetyltransferase